MSIFNSYGYDYEDFDLPVYEGYGVEVDGFMDACIESFDDDLEIIENMHSMDMLELRATSEGWDTDEFEAAYEASFGELKDKIANGLKKFWAKVKSFFASIARFFSAVFGNAQQWMSKYKGDLKKLNLSGYRASMYTFTLDKDDISKKVDALMNSTDVLGTGEITTEKIDEIVDGFRAKLLGDSGKVSSEEYRKELFKHFRNGDEDPSEELVNIDTMIGYVENGKVKQNAIKKTEDVIATAIGKMIKYISKNKGANSEDIKQQKMAVDLLKKLVQISLTYTKEYSTAVSDSCKTAMTVCRKAFSYKAQ